METTLAAAIETIRAINSGEAEFDEDRYLEACATVVARRGEIPHRIFIALPGGLSGNDDPRWASIKEGSKERCSCGNERVILPLAPRTDFLPSDGEKVIVAGGEDAGVYLKPRGGDKASTYVRLWITDAPQGPALAFLGEPFAPMVFSASMLSTPGYLLEKLAGSLQRATEPAVMSMGDQGPPVFAIESVDVSAKTVTLILDKDVEVLSEQDAAAAAGHQH